MKSRNGKLGQIVALPNRQGIRENGTYKTMQKFENQAGGKAEIADKLAAAEGLNAQEKKLLELMVDPANKRAALSYLIAEAGVDPARVIKKYAEGAVALGRAEALAEAARALGPIARQLVKQAAVHSVSCLACLGLGKVQRRPDAKRSQEIPCSSCQGTGSVERRDKDYKFAVQKILDMSKLGEESAVNVQTNVQTNVAINNSGFMERLSKLTDGSGAIVVDAETNVLTEDSEG